MVPLVFTLVTAVFPNCMVLLAATIAPLPMAVALLRLFAETSAAYPIAVLFKPVVFDESALLPIAVL